MDVNWFQFICGIIVGICLHIILSDDILNDEPKEKAVRTYQEHTAKH